MYWGAISQNSELASHLAAMALCYLSTPLGIWAVASHTGVTKIALQKKLDGRGVEKMGSVP